MRFKHDLNHSEGLQVNTGESFHGLRRKTDKITRESEQNCPSYRKITLPAAESVSGELRLREIAWTW